MGTNKKQTGKPCITLVPIFNHLKEEEMADIMKVIQTKSFKKGERIFQAGDTSDSLYIVNRGQIKEYRLSESGKEQLVRLLNPGDFTGELALFREGVHESYAEAMMNSGVCMITREDLQKFLMEYPTISLRILSEFSERLARSERQTTSLATEKVETRIAMFLGECVNSDDPEMVIELPMSKKDLASYLGTTPETISRKLAELEEQGYIQLETNRKVRILDLDGLLLV